MDRVKNKEKWTMDRRKELNLIFDTFAYFIGTILFIYGIATVIKGITSGITITALILGGILFIGSLIAIVIDFRAEVKTKTA
jgi:hypothetical protein